MSIDVNTIFEPDYNFSGVKSNGYRQVSKTIGIKTAGNSWDGAFKTLAELRKSHTWKKAEKEYKTQIIFSEANIGPELYSLTAAYNLLGMFVPCVKMEHVQSITLCNAYVKYDLIDRNQAEDILIGCHQKMASLGYLHGDLHGDNVLLTFNREKDKILRSTVIDFEYATKMPPSWGAKDIDTYINKDVDSLLHDYDNDFL